MGGAWASAWAPGSQNESRMTSGGKRGGTWNAPGVVRSAAIAMVGHRTESIYRRYAIADEAMLKEGAPSSQRFTMLGKMEVARSSR